MTEILTLKWGTVKGWSGLSETSVAALQLWADLGVSMSAMAQDKSDAPREALCHAIDVIVGNGGKIWNDWDGREMTAEAAKKYVMEYYK